MKHVLLTSVLALSACALAILFIPTAVCAATNASTDSDALIAFFIMIIIVFVMYLLPTFIASIRKHHQVNAIFVLNLFLGWTFVGWVIALVWAVSGHRV
jgi:Na+/H+-dicarboxylate symporter